MALSQYLKYVYVKYYIYYIHILAILDVYIILQNTKEHIITCLFFLSSHIFTLILFWYVLNFTLYIVSYKKEWLSLCRWAGVVASQWVQPELDVLLTPARRHWQLHLYPVAARSYQHSPVVLGCARPSAGGWCMCVLCACRLPSDGIRTGGGSSGSSSARLR